MAAITTVNYNNKYRVQNKQLQALNSSGAIETIKYVTSFVSSLKTARWLNTQSDIRESLYSYSIGQPTNNAPFHDHTRLRVTISLQIKDCKASLKQTDNKGLTFV